LPGLSLNSVQSLQNVGKHGGQYILSPFIKGENEGNPQDKIN